MKQTKDGGMYLTKEEYENINRNTKDLMLDQAYKSGVCKAFDTANKRQYSSIKFLGACSIVSGLGFLMGALFDYFAERQQTKRLLLDLANAEKTYSEKEQVKKPGSGRYEWGTVKPIVMEYKNEEKPIVTPCKENNNDDGDGCNKQDS